MYHRLLYFLLFITLVSVCSDCSNEQRVRKFIVLWKKDGEAGTDYILDTVECNKKILAPFAVASIVRKTYDFKDSSLEYKHFLKIVSDFSTIATTSMEVVYVGKHDSVKLNCGKKELVLYYLNFNFRRYGRLEESKCTFTRDLNYARISLYGGEVAYAISSIEDVDEKKIMKFKYIEINRCIVNDRRLYLTHERPFLK